jgi:penicillin amidase
MGFYRAAVKLIPKLDKETLSLLQAYSDGVNDYIKNNPDKLNYLFKKYGVTPELWTPADCIAVWWHLGQFFATDGTREMISRRNAAGGRQPLPAQRTRAGIQTQAPPQLHFDDSGAVIQRADVSEEWIAKTLEFVKQHGFDRKDSSIRHNTGTDEEFPKFSHAWVVGGAKTTTGSAVLNSDPQTQVRNPSLFYEFHICGKTFNARGIGVAGSPVILIGWNETVAWGVTALGADQADLFILETDSLHLNQYFFDNKWQKMTLIKEKILVKNSTPVDYTIKETHLGPVISEFAFLLPGEPDVALKRIPIAETNCETIQGAVAMMRAKDASVFSKAIERWRFPSVNIVFGDKSGTIGYWTLGAFPLRSSSDFTDGRDAVPGTESKYDWQGFIPFDLLPHVINPKKGYLSSANNRPIASFYIVPLGAGTGSSGDTGRSWRLRELLEQKQTFTPEDVLAVHYDSINPAKRNIVLIGYHLRDIQKINLSPDAQSALTHLEQWKNNPSSDLQYPGAALVNVIATQFRIIQTDITQIYGGGENGLCFFLKSAQSRIAQNPDAVISQSEITYIESTLANAWRSMQGQRFGSTPEKWNELLLEQVKRRPLGYFESLDGYPVLDTEQNVFSPALTCTDGGTIKSQASQSYSQWVPLHNVDEALSILPIGISELPDSPYRLSNYNDWALGKFHPAPITRKAVEQYIATSKIIAK